MQKTKNLNKLVLKLFIAIFIISNIFPLWLVSRANNSPEIVYPLKKVSKLECRYTDFDSLKSDCKQNLPILKTKDYSKYVKKGWGYNDYTRYYTVLWWASYKYGWDVWYGWHWWTDIASSRGTPVYSISDWKVIVAKKALGWWNVVTVEHYMYGKKVFSNYAHLDEISVKVWDKLEAWEKLWTLWNTWNSTWNHLHLQIDLDTPFHPYYYDSKTCPYSYNEITENWVCFDELEANTVDPLLFLETEWKILKELKNPEYKVEKVTVKDDNNSNNTKTIDTVNTSIFDRTVYVWYPSWDVRLVQQVLRDLELYDWELTWDYRDIENIVYDYQIKNSIVQNKSTPGAWWFWPKTRSSMKKDYDKFLASGKKHNYVLVEDSKTTTKTKKIERKNIMTREQIEAREYENFIRNYEFDLDLKNIWGNIKQGTRSKIEFSINKKYKNKPFRWNTPLDIAIIADESILEVFPKKFYNFTDGKRDIYLTWKKSWTTNVTIKFGSKTIKTYKIRVYSKDEKIYPESWIIYWNSKVVLADSVKWIAMFRDDIKKRLINVKYSWTYKLKWIWDTQVCIKKGILKNLSRIYKRTCNLWEYQKEIEFDYADTVAWILLFDYRSTGGDAKIEIINTYNNEKLAEKKLVVSNPKGLDSSYAYKDDVIKVLKNDIATNWSRWYFLEDRFISQYDSNMWMRNALTKIKLNTNDISLKNKVTQNLSLLSREPNSKNQTLNREEFLRRSYKYLILDDISPWWLRDYKDLDSDLNKKAYSLFGETLTWKDRFGENYFQPNKKITRWEVAFVLNNTLSTNNSLKISFK